MIDSSEWNTVVGRAAVFFHGGRTFGRFSDLLGEVGIEHLRTLARREGALRPERIFAELSSQPLQTRQANVAIRLPIRSYEIVVGTAPSVPPEHILSLNHLVVDIQHGRFYVRSLRFGKWV